jgi:hypothetical protein
VPSCSPDELVDSPLTSSVAESQGRSAALLIAASVPWRASRTRCSQPSSPRPARQPAPRRVLRRGARPGRVRRRAARSSRQALRELQGDPAEAHRGLGPGAPLLDERQRALAVVDLRRRRMADTSRSKAAERARTRHGGPSTPPSPHSSAMRTRSISRRSVRSGSSGSCSCSPSSCRASSRGARRLAAAPRAIAQPSRRSSRSSARSSSKAGIDWMWELTVVSVVAILALGTAHGAGHRARAQRAAGGGGTTRPAGLPDRPRRDRFRPHRRRGDSAARHHGGAKEPGTRSTPATSWRRSTRPSRRGASSPGPRLRIFSSRSSRSSAAGSTRPLVSIETALQHDQSDWRLWLVAARIQTKAGEIADARQSLAKARELNPKSQLFAG